MIDIHSHILPNIDDGSRSIEESINIIKEAKQVGFDEIISTSHYIEGYYEVANNERMKLIQDIKNELDKEKVDMKICIGNENYLSDNMVDLVKENKASTLNNTKYLLFEMPLNVKPLNIYNIVYEAFQHGFIPILAHPERYRFVQEDISLINDLIEKGVLMQLNYASIIGYYGKGAKIVAKKMLENNMVHFLGSDVHRQNTIYPKMQEILSTIEKIVGNEKLNELTTINPKKILDNQDIDIEIPNQIKMGLKEKIMMKINYR